MHQFSSELPFHMHDWLIISLKDFCFVIRKWLTFFAIYLYTVKLKVYCMSSTNNDTVINSITRFLMDFYTCSFDLSIVPVMLIINNVETSF